MNKEETPKKRIRKRKANQNTSIKEMFRLLNADLLELGYRLKMPKTLSDELKEWLTETFNTIYKQYRQVRSLHSADTWAMSHLEIFKDLPEVKSYKKIMPIYLNAIKNGVKKIKYIKLEKIDLPKGQYLKLINNGNTILLVDPKNPPPPENTSLVNNEPLLTSGSESLGVYLPSECDLPY